MKGSLRDQLLKAGLVDEKRAKKAQMESRREATEARKARKSGAPEPPSASEVAARKALRERERQAQRSRELNRAREEDRARKTVRAEASRLLAAEAQPHGKGDRRYHFVEGTKVKRIYVDPAQQKALAAGELAIVAWEGRHHVVPREVAERVQDWVPEAFVFVSRPEETDPDDPYAAYPIPDDLEW